jgi:pimeloyl-ACP methyl ester carboxylesterase
MHFVGKQAANTHEEVMQLKAGLLVKPDTALKLFSRGHGVREAWMDIEATPERVQTLAMSLDTLCQAMPIPKKLPEFPVYAAYGDRDSLVNEWMVHEFVEATGAKLFPALEGVSHAMFYEQPQELAPLFQSCLEG